MECWDLNLDFSSSQDTKPSEQQMTTVRTALIDINIMHSYYGTQFTLMPPEAKEGS